MNTIPDCSASALRTNTFQRGVEARYLALHGECAAATSQVDGVTDPLPARCALLSGPELELAKALAACRAARERAGVAGLDPDEACIFLIKAAPHR